MCINRKQLVQRHNPVLQEFDVCSPLSVGNGEFAFTADLTGLQSFLSIYDEAMPLCTQSQWGWHTAPVSAEKKAYTLEDLNYELYDTYGRAVPYATQRKGPVEVSDWLRHNPHRLHLGQIGLHLIKEDGSIVAVEDIQDPYQKLDLWTGILESTFSVEGVPVSVKTCCHPQVDGIAATISSPLIAAGRLFVKLRFPYGSHLIQAADWNQPKKHKTIILEQQEEQIHLKRMLDDDIYFAHLGITKDTTFIDKGAHEYHLAPPKDVETMEFFCSFSLEEENIMPTVSDTFEASIIYWEDYWMTGGIIELANSKDPRGLELERRVILSQYLTAIQCAGSLPPQETGLTCNSWYGKFHLEMHLWHAAHFPLWSRGHLLERSMWWYQEILEEAKKLARFQGYEGARWPKMVGPAGIDSPSTIATLLIWQQPHPIVYAELCYRENPKEETLKRYQEIVFESAEFMASYAVYDKEQDRYVLGAPVIPAQERHDPRITINPTFELEYWSYGLSIANEWRERLGMEKNKRWEEVRNKLSLLPMKDGVYLAHENCPETFEKVNDDHPSMVGALGLLPGTMVDPDMMRNTLKRVMKEWRLEESWGWDFPMIAMTAARLGEPEIALDVLLMDTVKNVYITNGHNRQETRKDLPLYLPGNGGLLLAVAMMAAGWKGNEDEHAPGFPKDGSWDVRFEGLKPIL